jgi:hypothetical protein
MYMRKNEKNTILRHPGTGFSGTQFSTLKSVGFNVPE